MRWMTWRTISTRPYRVTHAHHDGRRALARQALRRHAHHVVAAQVEFESKIRKRKHHILASSAKFQAVSTWVS